MLIVIFSQEIFYFIYLIFNNYFSFKKLNTLLQINLIVATKINYWIESILLFQLLGRYNCILFTLSTTVKTIKVVSSKIDNSFELDVQRLLPLDWNFVLHDLRSTDLVGQKLLYVKLYWSWRDNPDCSFLKCCRSLMDKISFW